MTWLSIISFTFSTLLALTFVDVDRSEQDRTGQNRRGQVGKNGRWTPLYIDLLEAYTPLPLPPLFCSQSPSSSLLFLFFFFLLFLLIFLSLSLPPTPQISVPLFSPLFLSLSLSLLHLSHPIPEPNLKPQNGGQVSPTRPSSDSIRRVGRQHRTGRSSSRCGIFSFELGLEV